MPCEHLIGREKEKETESGQMFLSKVIYKRT